MAKAELDGISHVSAARSRLIATLVIIGSK